MSKDTNKARLIILADMDNEPDEEQQMVHMLTCSNMFHLEGLIAVTGKYLRTKPVPELFHHLIDGYDQVLDNLKQHADGWHETAYLRSITHAGQQNYGMADVGDGQSSPGSNQIVSALTNDDPRPLYVVINAGSNTLAQALWDLRASQSPEQMDAIVAKLQVFENGAQDNAGAWIAHTFPAIHWMRSNFQTYSYGGPDRDGGSHFGLGPYTWEPYAYSALGQHHWDLEHIISAHGPLGARFPIRIFQNDGRLLFKEGGGTVPWLGLLNRGLYDPAYPWWGGWSGRFTHEPIENFWSRHDDVRADEAQHAPFKMYGEAPDTWIDPETNQFWAGDCVPVWRWRRAMFNNQRCRMDWCICSYEEANHHPQAVLNGVADDVIIRLDAKPGQMIVLDASGSNDPDGDPIDIRWWVYSEAGTYPGEVKIDDPNAVATTMIVPEDAAGGEIHVILEIQDKNPIASLSDYRRLVITAL